MIPDKIDLSSKTIVVTGASSGVGRAMAIELARHGAKLILAARRLDVLEEVARECESYGAIALAVQTDTRSADGIRELAQKANEYGGSVDVWINNAGVMATGALEDVPSSVHEDLIKVNLLGYIHGAQAILPYFKQQGYGILINNISVGGWFPVPYGAAYSASKFGLRGFSEALKGELSNEPNIHVCDLYPAFLDTPGIQHAANYTGKVIRPAPPVVDPQIVAREVVRIIRQPRSTIAVGVMSPFLRITHALFPVLSRNITAWVIRTYLNQADPIEKTPGNILDTVNFGSSIHGGWSKPSSQSTARKAGMVAGSLALVALTVMVARRKQKR